MAGPDPLDVELDPSSFDPFEDALGMETSRVVESRDVDPMMARGISDVPAGVGVADKTVPSMPAMPPVAAPMTPPDDELGPGEMLGPTYRVIEKLAEGGMGIIYVVEHMRMKKRFAAKVLKSALCTPDNIKRMDREATASSRIDHPCVVRVVNLDEDAVGRQYIISELLDGRDLSARLREGPVPPDEAVAIGIQVAAGLGAAHASGVIHRDLKPENIFMCEDGGEGPQPVKVLDFGISSMLFEGDMERLTAVGSLIGTPAYMSPEHVRGAPVDARSDVYSFGVMLFEMLTGDVPFSSPKPMQVVLMHLREMAPAPSAHNPDVPASLDRVVLKCLAKDPEARYPSMDALADDLQAIADAAGWPVPLIRASVPTSEVRAPSPLPAPAPASTPAPAPALTPDVGDSRPADRVITEMVASPADLQADDGGTLMRSVILILLALLAAAGVAAFMNMAEQSGEPPVRERKIIQPKPAPP